MPAAWVGAGAAAIGAINGLAGGGGGGGGGSSGGWGSTTSNAFKPLAGGIATSLNPPQAQTSPGAYSPPSNIGEGYNYIPTGQGSIDQLIQQILLSSGSIGLPGAGAAAVAPFSGVPGNIATLISQADNPQARANYMRDVGGLTGQLDTEGGSQVSYGNRLRGTGQSYIDIAMASLPQYQQLFDLGFDPRQALYDRTLKQVQNQARAAGAARGLNASGVGAGIENQATRNFNIDWQNQQLQRAIQAAAGYGQGLRDVGTANTVGTNMTSTGSALAQNGLGLREHSINLANNAPLGAVTPALTAQTQGLDAVTAYLRALFGGQGLDQQSRAADISARLAPLQGAQSYLSGAFQPNYLSNVVGLKQAELVGNQNANAAAGLSSGLDSIFRGLPGAVGAAARGLGSLYDSIFGSSNSDNPADYGYGNVTNDMLGEQLGRMNYDPLFNESGF